MAWLIQLTEDALKAEALELMYKRKNMDGGDAIRLNKILKKKFKKDLDHIIANISLSEV